LIFHCWLSQILAMDVNREHYELGLPIIKKAGVAHKIDFREGPALPVLDKLVEDVKIFSYPFPCFSFRLSLIVWKQKDTDQTE